jgi:hypothetical protein
MINLINKLVYIHRVCDFGNDITNFIINVSFNILYFINQQNDYDSYLKISDIKYHLSLDQFNEMIELVDCPAINNVYCNKTVIEIIYDIVKKEKIFKNFYKDFDNYNENMKIMKNITVKKEYGTVLNLFSNMGECVSHLKRNNIKYDKIYCYENDDNLNKINYLNNILSNNVNLENNIIKSNIIYDDIITDKKGDLIICNIINNSYKNLIYTNCNSLIKKIKIRGTKSEPLILQLILQLVNKNGDIILITPNSLLFSESNQHIETRKYLLNNFNLFKIIEFENKQSILFINNSKFEDKIEVHKDNKINIVTLNDINKTTYNLYFNFTNNHEKPLHSQDKLENMINIIENNNIIINDSVLYSKNFNSLQIGPIDSTTEYNYIFLTKDETKMNQKFLNIFLQKFLNNNTDFIVKGKMKKFCKDSINELKISTISLETQKIIVDQESVNKETINKNNQQIDNYKILKNQFNNHIVDDTNTEKLLNIFNISNVLLDDSYITIKKNSLSAGKVELIKNRESLINNTNYYYLNFKNINHMLNEYYYYILKYLENILILNSTKNKSNGLNRTFVENLEIPILSNEQSNHFIEVNKFFDIQIEFLENTNDKLLYFYKNLLELII